MKKVVLVILLCLAFSAAPSRAQDAISQLPYLVVQNAGINGFLLPETTSPSSRFNPAGVANMSRTPANGLVSGLFGSVMLPRGEVHMNSLAVSARTGKVCWNVALYRSDTSTITFQDTSSMRGVQTNFTIDATELTAGYAVSPKLSVGASWILNEDTRMSLRSARSGVSLADITGRASSNFRAGFQYRPCAAVTLSAVYASRRDDFSFTNHPALTKQAGDTHRDYQYTTSIWVPGVSCRLGKTTTVFYNQELVSTTGPTSSSRDFAYYGVQQMLGKNTAVKLVSDNGSIEYHLNYRNRDFLIGGYYCEGGKAVEELVGTPRRVSLTIGRYF